MYMYNNLRLCFFAFWLRVLTLFTTEHSFGSLSFLQVQEILKNHHHHHPSTASHPQLAHSFVFFWKHLTLVDISLLSITLTAIAHFRAVYMMSSSEKCLLGLIHSCTWLQKGLSRSPCWVFSSERAHSMCTCWGVYPSPLTKYMQAYMYLVTILHIVILSNSKTKHLCSYVSVKILIFWLKLAAYKN